ncbi:MAG: ATP-dependent Clp protease adaptor ClpS [Treponema sp.]|jgi:ATP-dependent Clp protease adaptor protein ClpS|nr:ATP-dependent Clp protease adaptor ClpS [Treponema sp.]
MPVELIDDSRTLPKKKEALKEPEDYAVILLNDDFTTRDFVVEVLKRVFHLSGAEATRIMLHVHYKGRGVVGYFTWDIANTKVGQVHAFAREYNYPLRCVVESVN